MQATPMKRHDAWSLGRVPKLAYKDWIHPKEEPFSGFGHNYGRDFTSGTLWKGREICHCSLWKELKKQTDASFGYVRKGQKKLPASVFYSQLSLLKMDTFRTDTKYPSKRDFRLVESQIKEGTNSRCRPVLQRGAHVTEVSINKELTIFIFKRQCI